MDKPQTDVKNDVKDAKTDVKNPAPVYSVAQLADGFRAFKTSRAIVEAALKLAHKDCFTMDEARKIVDNFKNKR